VLRLEILCSRNSFFMSSPGNSSFTFHIRLLVHGYVAYTLITTGTLTVSSFSSDFILERSVLFCDLELYLIAACTPIKCIVTLI
jgi:hypothetical protein